MTPICSVPRCGQPIRSDRVICPDCARVLEHDLASIPGLVEDLLITITRQDVLGPSSGGRRAAETAVPWKDHAAEMLGELTNTVSSWARVLLEHYRLSSAVIDRAVDGQPTSHHVAIRAARWLYGNRKSLAMHEAAGEAVDELGDAVRRAYAAIDSPPEKLPAGQCLADGCPAYLYADPHAETVDCPKCSATHGMAERHAWMSAQAVEHRVTSTEAFGWVRMLLGKELPASTWRRWLTQPLKGDSPRISHDDMDHLGRKLYRWGDVVEAVRDHAVAMARPGRGKPKEAAA